MREGLVPPNPAQGQHGGRRSARRQPRTSKEEVSETGDGAADDKGKDTVTGAAGATENTLEPRKTYACDECDKVYFNKGNKERHKKKKHLSTPEDASQTSPKEAEPNQFDADGILEALNNSFIVETEKVVAEESGFESNGADNVEEKGKDTETGAAGSTGNTLEPRKRKKSETEDAGTEVKKRKTMMSEAVAEKPRVTTFNLAPTPPSPKPWRAISLPDYGEINEGPVETSTLGLRARFETLVDEKPDEPHVRHMTAEEVIRGEFNAGGCGSHPMEWNITLADSDDLLFSSDYEDELDVITIDEEGDPTEEDEEPAADAHATAEESQSCTKNTDVVSPDPISNESPDNDDEGDKNEGTTADVRVHTEPNLSSENEPVATRTTREDSPASTKNIEGEVGLKPVNAESLERTPDKGDKHAAVEEMIPAVEVPMEPNLSSEYAKQSVKQVVVEGTSAEVQMSEEFDPPCEEEVPNENVGWEDNGARSELNGTGDDINSSMPLWDDAISNILGKIEDIAPGSLISDLEMSDDEDDEESSEHINAHHQEAATNTVVEVQAPVHQPGELQGSDGSADPRREEEVSNENVGGGGDGARCSEVDGTGNNINSIGCQCSLLSADAINNILKVIEPEDEVYQSEQDTDSRHEEEASNGCCDSASQNEALKVENEDLRAQVRALEAKLVSLKEASELIAKVFK